MLEYCPPYKYVISSITILYNVVYFQELLIISNVIVPLIKLYKFLAANWSHLFLIQISFQWN